MFFVYYVARYRVVLRLFYVVAVYTLCPEKSPDYSVHIFSRFALK